MSMSTGTTRNVSSTGPASFQQPYVNQMLAEAQKLYQSPGPLYYGGNTVAGFTPAEQQGQASTMSAASEIAGLQPNITSAYKTGLGAADVNNNPYLKSSVEGAIRPVYQNLTETALPSIRSGAAAGGSYGGSRQGIAEGLAIRGANQTAADTSAKMYSDAYNNGLGVMSNTLSQTPTIMSSLTAPGTLQAGVGEQQRAMEQANIDAAMQKYNYEQALPYMKLAEYGNFARLPLGGTSTSEVSATGGDKATQTLGGILAGAGVGIDILKKLRIL